MTSQDTITSCSVQPQRQLEVLGQPIRKSVFNRYADNMETFIEAHARKLRFMQKSLAEYTQLDIDGLISTAFYDLASHEYRAQAAFKAHAWLHTFKPYAHPSRNFYFDSSRLLDIIKLHPDSLYRYGLFFSPPSKEIHDRLTALHPPTAKLYWNFCVASRVAEVTGYDMKALVNW